MSDIPATPGYARAPWPEPPAKPTSYPVLVFMILIVLTPLVAASQLMAHLRLDVVDDQMFGYYGWRIAHGATVYKDVWDNKPPGIYWINAVGFLISGDSYGGVIALCVVALVAAHIAFFVIAASIYFREAAAVATVLASFFLTHGYYQCGTNRTETFLIACELSAVALYFRGFARDRWWKWLAAGALCGAAFLFKQVGLAAWGAMGLHMIVLTLTRQVRFMDGLRRCLLLAAGCAAVLGIASAALAAQGVFNEALFATFAFNRAYFKVGDTGSSGWIKNYYMLRNAIFPVLLAPILMMIPAWIHSFLWWVRPLLRPPEIEVQLKELRPVCPRYMLLFTTWLGAACVGALLSPHAFRHYIAPCIAPMMLLDGYLISVIMAETKLLRRMQQRAWATAALVAIGYFASEAAWRQFEEVSKVWVSRIELREKAEWEQIGDVVAAVTRPQDKIQCWGYLPGVYLRARRVNVCRYTTTEKMGQVKQEAFFVGEELHDKIMADPPEVFVISSGDYLWLHGIAPAGSTQPADPLGAWIADRYEKVAEVKNIYVLKRKPAADSRPAAGSQPVRTTWDAPRQSSSDGGETRHS